VTNPRRPKVGYIHKCFHFHAYIIKSNIHTPTQVEILAAHMLRIRSVEHLKMLVTVWYAIAWLNHKSHCLHNANTCQPEKWAVGMV